MTAAETPEAVASIYVVDRVATAAFGTVMNDAGNVTGASYPDPGCGSCLGISRTIASARFPVGGLIG